MPGSTSPAANCARPRWRRQSWAATLERIRPAEIMIPDSLPRWPSRQPRRRPDDRTGRRHRGRRARALPPSFRHPAGRFRHRRRRTGSGRRRRAAALRPGNAGADGCTSPCATAGRRARVGLHRPRRGDAAQPRTDRDAARRAGADAVFAARHLHHGRWARAACATRCTTRCATAPFLLRAMPPSSELMDDASRGAQSRCARALKGIADIERIAGRIALFSARPRDLSGLRDGLARLARSLRAPLAGWTAAAGGAARNWRRPAPLDLLTRHRHRPSTNLRDGGVIAPAMTPTSTNCAASRTTAANSCWPRSAREGAHRHCQPEGRVQPRARLLHRGHARQRGQDRAPRTTAAGKR